MCYKSSMKQKTQITSIADAFAALLALIPNLGTWKISPTERRYRLDRMRLLLERFENPHLAYRVFHIAGTKGKGSTAAFLASALGVAGYQTGLYTSPHVSDPGERISVTVPPSDHSIIADLVAQIKEAVCSIPPADLPGGFHWTAFELVTVLAFLYFRAAKCRFAVIETGIGGRWDATNVVQPFTCALTPIDLEHTDVLGGTLERIAREKAGIIKSGVPVFSAPQMDEVSPVFEEASHTHQAPLTWLQEAIEKLDVTTGLAGTEVVLKLRGGHCQRFRLQLRGDFQAENAALAYLTLRNMLPRIPCHAIIKGLENTSLPGRMEVIQTTPPIVLDGAHTPLALKRLLASFTKIFHEPGVLIFGAIAGKNIDEMATILAPCFRKIIISTPGTFKESHPEDMFERFNALNPHTELERDPRAALQRALGASREQLPILVTGSFYLVAEIRKYFLDKSN
jgi:dihydrofolate synthase/folylpolyglutamate synthase